MLTGTGTYTGDTVIGGGTLLANGTLKPTAFVLVSLPRPRSAAPATSARSPSAPDALRQDSARGRLTSHGVGIGAGHRLAIELNGTTPGAPATIRCASIGQVYIGLAALELTVGGGFTPPPGATFTIVDNDGSEADQRHVRRLRRRRDGDGRRAVTTSGSVMSVVTATTSSCRTSPRSAITLPKVRPASSSTTTC